MGNNNSHLEIEQVGYRVLGVQPGSPSCNAGLVSFFDFIVEANSIPLKVVDTTFMDIIKDSEDKELLLKVYNCKSHTTRDVIIIPSRNWDGEGMLGVTIRFDTYFDAEEHLCHILDVEPNSPAELAGLQPDRDYLLGTAEKVFKDTDILFDELKQNLEKPIEFYVYNADTDEVRIVVLMPSDQWGKEGDGILGAGVAHGFLHGLPSTCCNSTGRSIQLSLKGTELVNLPFGNNENNYLEKNIVIEQTNNIINKSNIDSNIQIINTTLPNSVGEIIIEENNNSIST